jgi:hypothetical protein
MPLGWSSDLWEAREMYEGLLATGVLNTATTVASGKLLITGGVSVATLFLNEKNGIDPNSKLGLTIRALDVAANAQGCVVGGIGLTSLFLTGGIDAPIALTPTVLASISCAVFLVNTGIEVKEASEMKGVLTPAETAQLSTDLNVKLVGQSNATAAIQPSNDPAVQSANLMTVKAEFQTIRADVPLAIAADAANPTAGNVASLQGYYGSCTAVADSQVSDLNSKDSANSTAVTDDQETVALYQYFLSTPMNLQAYADQFCNGDTAAAKLELNQEVADAQQQLSADETGTPIIRQQLTGYQDAVGAGGDSPQSIDDSVADDTGDIEEPGDPDPPDDSGGGDGGGD